jgi:hypothetical protein
LDAVRSGDRRLAEDILFQALGQHVDLKGIMP